MLRTVSRHEIKYIISTYEAELLKHRLAALLRRDPHTRRDGGYFIRSLYFDDASFSAYNDKLNGVKERTKYRIRYYNYDPRHIFLEKKCKDADLTGKDSAGITRELAEALIDGTPGINCEEGLVGEFGRLRLADFKPVVLVDYDRFPFIYRDGNVRVTLDMNIRTSPYQTEFFEKKLLSIPVMDENEAVLEVKYDEFLPAPVRALLEGVPKQRSAVSKYTRCLGILE